MLDLVIAAVVKALFHGSLRVDEADEALGPDASQHGDAATPRSPDSIAQLPRLRTLPFNTSRSFQADLAKQTSLAVPKYAALSSFRGAISWHTGKPASLTFRATISLIKRGIYYEENYGDRSC